MTKKRIIHLIQSLDNGGCENMLLRVLPLLLDFDHTIITLNKEGELASKFKEKNIQIINLKQKSLLDLYSYTRLLNIIEEIQPNIILTYLFHADVIGRLFIQKRTNFKVIPFLRTTYNHKKYWLPRLFEKLTYKQVPHYLANSKSVKNFITKIGVSEDKVTIIPNGIDMNFYDQVPRDEKLRQNLGIKTDETVIICVANLHINKGHKYLLEAFEQVFYHYRENKNPAPHLLIVGDGIEKENLLNQVANYSSRNNVHFLGKRNDVPQLLKISEIFVLPTIFEGMSNAIMEAMTSKLAVITTNIPENQELIKHEESGILITIKNFDEIINALKLLIDKNTFRLILGNNAKNSIYEKFNLEKIKSKWISLFNKK